MKIAVSNALDRANASALIENVVAGARDLPLTLLINNIGSINGIVKPQFKSFENHGTQEISDTIDRNECFSMRLTSALFPVLKKNEPGPGHECRLYGGEHEDTVPCSLFGHQSHIDGLECERSGGNAPWRAGRLRSRGILVGNTSTAGRHGIPTARVMAAAAAALERVGCGRDAMPGYFPHAMQQAGLALIPSWLVAVFVGIEATKLRNTDLEAS